MATKQQESLTLDFIGSVTQHWNAISHAILLRSQNRCDKWQRWNDYYRTQICRTADHEFSCMQRFRSQSFFLWMELLKMICFALCHIESYQCISSMRSLSSPFYVPLLYHVSALSHFSAISLSIRLFRLYKLRGLTLWIRTTDRKSPASAIGACPVEHCESRGQAPRQRINNIRIGHID